jgi:DNA ligase-1
VRFLAYDLLEQDGHDLRQLSLAERRLRLTDVVDALDPARFGVSRPVDAADWAALHALRASSRDRRVEGLMLKRRDSAYGTGRERGSWWKWKVDPWTFDGVLLYAQPGHGRRSNLYTDYTFGVWQDGALLPVAKAYSGLTDAEIATLDRWIRAHTTEKFGPVRSVEPTLVFELAFEGIARSSRHKSGLAMRFPRIVRQRHDKPAAEADSLATLSSLVDATAG